MPLIREGTFEEGTNLGEKISSGWDFYVQGAQSHTVVVEVLLDHLERPTGQPVLSQSEPQPPRSADEEGSENIL